MSGNAGPNEIWRVQPRTFRWSARLRTNGATIFAIATQSTGSDLVAVSLSTGEFLWRRPITHWLACPWSAPLIEGDLLYWCDYRDIWCIDCRDGRLIRQHRLCEDRTTLASPIISGNLMLRCTNGGELTAWDRESFDPVWEVSAGWPARATPVVDGEFVFFVAGCSRQSDVFCVHLGTGTVVWRTSFSGQEHFLEHPPVVSGDLVLVPDGSKRCLMLAITKSRGEVVWKRMLPPDLPRFNQAYHIDCGALMCDGIACWGGRDGYMRALSSIDGRCLWSVSTDGAIESAAVSLRGDVLFGSNDRFLRCVVAKDGLELWRFRCSAPVRLSPLVAGNVVIVGTDDGSLTALTCPTLQTR